MMVVFFNVFFIGELFGVLVLSCEVYVYIQAYADASINSNKIYWDYSVEKRFYLQHYMQLILKTNVIVNKTSCSKFYSTLCYFLFKVSNCNNIIVTRCGCGHVIT